MNSTEYLGVVASPLAQDARNQMIARNQIAR